MYNKMVEIENISSKIQTVFNVLEFSNYKNISDLSNETNIDLSELADVLNIMKKSEYIDKVNDEKIKITQYGELIKEGKINIGYAPV